MTQTIKMEEGNKTPTLYNFYDDQYDFTDLQKRVDSGLNDYISTLKKGKKYDSQIREAIANLMSGVGDGTITFGNGRYNDSLGRYSNAQDKDKDVYGWAANYIYNNMKQSRKYVAPEDKSKQKWNENALSQALVKGIFNSSSPNVDYFIDQDPLDTDTNTRGTSVRAKMITDWIDNNVNDALFDKYTGYTDEDKQRYIKLAQEASSKLKQNGVNPEDYLFLSRVFPGISWETMFKTDQTKNQSDESESSSPQDFNAFMDKWSPRTEGDTANVSLNINGAKLGPGTNRDIVNWANGLDYQSSYNFLNTYVSNPNYNSSVNSSLNPVMARAIIQRLERDGKLVQDSNDSNIYYIPELKDDKTHSGFYYDSKTKTLYKKNLRDIPYWKDIYYKQYSGQGDYSQYFTNPQYKQGGIIKAQDGTKFWYSGLTDYDPTKYKYSYDTSKLVNSDMSDDNFDPWVSNVSGVGTGRYKPSVGNTKDYTQGIEDTQYYKNFGNALLNPDGTFTDVGLAWAKAVDAQLPRGSKATFFDNNGQLRTLWEANNNDTYGRPKQRFTNLADYVNYVRNDQILGSRHNVFLNQGNRYFYKDENGVEHWVNPDQISNYTVSDDPVRSQWNDDKTIYWHDYELTGLKPPKPDESHVDPRAQETIDEFSGDNFEDIMEGLTPGFLGAGRLFASLNTNNRVAKTLDRSLRPVLKDTYERYSPVTGAFSEMQFRNRQAADLRRQVARPFTSDASLQLAGELDANRQANDLEYQGFLADDKEIRRTREAALARQEDNMARRSEVANFNRASLNQTNREKAQLEATRLKQNWQSVDNFLQDIESRATSELEKKKALRQSLSAQVATNRYQEAIQNLDKWYREQNPNATTDSMLKDPWYTDKVRELKRRYQYDAYNIGMGRYYTNPYPNKERIKSYDQILYSKNGGPLRPSIMNLIRNVIRNENNS